VQKPEEKLVFWLNLDPIFSSLRPSNPPLFKAVEEGNLVYNGEKFQPLIQMEGSQPLAQSRHDALSNCQICSCRLLELASLGWCHVRLFASEPLKTIPRRRGMSGDQFRASFDKFGGR